MKQLLERLGLFLQRRQAYVRIRAELETYSERELHDMGILAADLDRVAREAAGLAKPTDGLGQGAYFGTRASQV